MFGPKTPFLVLRRPSPLPFKNYSHLIKKYQNQCQNQNYSQLIKKDQNQSQNQNQCQNQNSQNPQFSSSPIENSNDLVGHIHHFNQTNAHQNHDFKNFNEEIKDEGKNLNHDHQNEKADHQNEKADQNIKADDQNIKADDQNIKADDQNIKPDHQNFKADDQNFKADLQSFKADHQNCKASDENIKCSDENISHLDSNAIHSSSTVNQSKEEFLKKEKPARLKKWIFKWWNTANPKKITELESELVFPVKIIGTRNPKKFRFWAWDSFLALFFYSKLQPNLYLTFEDVNGKILGPIKYNSSLPGWGLKAGAALKLQFGSLRGGFQNIYFEEIPRVLEVNGSDASFTVSGWFGANFSTLQFNDIPGVKLRYYGPSIFAALGYVQIKKGVFEAEPYLATSGIFSGRRLAPIGHLLAIMILAFGLFLTVAPLLHFLGLLAPIFEFYYTTKERFLRN